MPIENRLPARVDARFPLGGFLTRHKRFASDYMASWAGIQQKNHQISSELSIFLTIPSGRGVSGTVRRRVSPGSSTGRTSGWHPSLWAGAANAAGGGKADKARFMNLAEGSLEESRYYLILAQDSGYGDVTNWPAPWRKSAACSTPTPPPF